MSEATGGADAAAICGLSPNPNWRSLPLFDRSTWTRVRFGDVVQNVNETERDPAGAGLERFVGLEHLERIVGAYRQFGDEASSASVARMEECFERGGSLSIPLYVNNATARDREIGDAVAVPNLAGALEAWLESSIISRNAVTNLLDITTCSTELLKSVGRENSGKKDHGIGKQNNNC